MMRADSTNRTYVFEGEEVYAMENGKIVAASKDVGELEDQTDEDSEEESSEESDSQKEATHIVTPGGLKGKIISRTAGLWSDEIAVRLENGNIAHYHVLADTEFVTEEEPEEANPIVALKARLHANYDETKPSLIRRRQDLDGINREARDLIQKGASASDIETLDKIALQTEDERAHIDDRLEQIELDEGEAFAPPAPFETQVVEQGAVGRGDGGWLDTTLNDMIEEAQDFDYESFMNEGPEALVAEIDDVPLADQGAVQSIAASVVREKTAAADPEVREQYEKKFLARVEEVRRAELSTRKETAKKEASVQKDSDDNAPDESLFL